MTESIARPRPRPSAELNRKVYLGLYDSRSWPEPDSRDEQRVRDYMVQKYENKRWYVAPTEAMKEEAKRANEAALNSKPQVKPLRSLLGENAPKLTVGSAHHPPPVGQPHAPLTVPAPGAFKPPPPTSTQVSAPPTTAPAKPSSGFDLLGDLGGDPFASNVVASNSHGDSGGFADFSNFDNMSSAPSQTPASAPSHVAPQPQAFPISSTPLQPFGLGQTQAQTPTTAPQAQAPTASMSASDRYAALADLDSAFSAPTTTATSINWGGMEGGSTVNWGGTSSAASTPSQSTPGGLSWNSTTSGGGGQINWGSQSSAGMPMGNTPPSGGFGAPSTAANPFGGGANPGMTAFTSAAPSSTVNPFGAAAPSSMPMTQFSQAGGMVAGMPASSVAGFGGQFVVPGSQPTSFGQFPPMQNGGFGMTATSGYGGAPAFSQQQFMIPSQPAGVQQAGAWRQMGAMPQGSQPVANPFMNTAMHQQVPPPSGSTNPFL